MKSTIHQVKRIAVFMFYIYIQGIFLMLSPMMADAGVPELSINNTLLGLQAGIFVTLPSIVAFVMLRVTMDDSKLKRSLLITLGILIFGMVDLVQPLAGAYNISGYVANQRYERKVANVKENHPSKDKGAVQLPTAYGTYYYNTETQEVTYVYPDRIEILDREIDAGDKEALYTFPMGDGLTVEVLQQNIEGSPLLFRISGGDYRYSIDNRMLFQGEKDAHRAHFEPYYELFMDGTVISIKEVEGLDQRLSIMDDKLGLLFIKDGQRILERSFGDGSEPFGISELDLLMEEGDWSVTLYTYVDSLEGYHTISNTVNWIR